MKSHSQVRNNIACDRISGYFALISVDINAANISRLSALGTQQWQMSNCDFTTTFYAHSCPRVRPIVNWGTNVRLGQLIGRKNRSIDSPSPEALTK